MGMTTSVAVNGPELSKMKELLKMMSALGTEMKFKYPDLKDSLSKCLREFPDIARRYDEGRRARLPELLASAMVTIAAHTRRLKDDIRYQQALSKCTDFQAEELAEIRALVHKAEAPVTMAGKPGPSSPKRSKKKEWSLPNTPRTPWSEQEEDPVEAEAKVASPIPCRKGQIKAALGLKKPAASKAKVKKPATAKREKSQYSLMWYKAGKGAWAVRVTGGRQLFQVVVGEKNKEIVKNRCQKAIQKLKAGEDEDLVRAWAKQV
eukprot:Skav211350  [mRNA]  locus=scaffold2448:122574:123362:- [translate_table: standard]